ncbi:MAG: alpha amylase C-terminal domain-containing protein [Thermodesulfobacteriota bacterium]
MKTMRTGTPDKRCAALIAADNGLGAYRTILLRRIEKIQSMEKRLTHPQENLSDFANGHEYFGMHFRNGQWIFREWAPNATAIFLIGEMSAWKEKNEFALEPNGKPGEWEIRLPEDRFHHGDLYRLRLHWPDGQGDRIPAYARRVVQDPRTLIFNAQIWRPQTPYPWRLDTYRRSPRPPIIYEAHIGMAQEDGKIGSYQEFTENVLPRIIAARYNTLQLMAIQEHPYYASFGYHVSNFFAASSRFGTPEDLKALIDAAHAAGLAVIMDLVHSHAVNNEVEGLSRFDGTPYQYFHDGPRGRHEAWDSRCFDYGKIEVLHFLLSNCRFWLDEYRFDGFRFDGITSMLYHHHGLGVAFTEYSDYFDETVDEDALTYLALANRVIHLLRPDAATIAEDVSGMPGLAFPVDLGGYGFDFRLAMGVPDYWIKLTKETRDEDWPMGHLWYELTNRRREEKTIGYAESHDQALVGDQTLIFRLIGADMYEHMMAGDGNLRVDRGLAIHKLIRLITLATAGNGYLNFMGNEFGHPEWIDFPRQGNNWSYHYSRRQWSLLDRTELKYCLLACFDRDMILLAEQTDLLSSSDIRLVYENSRDKVLAFERGGLLFVFCFHPTASHTDYAIRLAPGKYRMIFDSDRPAYGGHNRLMMDQIHFTQPAKTGNAADHQIRLYLPSRTALILKREHELG